MSENRAPIADTAAFQENLLVLLNNEGWPKGLQESLINSCAKYPFRFFIIDDSGSMQTNDGHRIVLQASNRQST